MQGVGTPVSADGQGGKAGREASSSCNRSSTLVGDLANVGYNTTRRSHNSSHDFDSNRDVFCYICCKYEVNSLRKQIDDNIKVTYKEISGLHIGEHSWVPNIIFNSCRNKHKIVYKTVTSVKALILTNKDKKETHLEHKSVIGHAESDNTDSAFDTKAPMLVLQPELNDLVQNLYLQRTVRSFSFIYEAEIIPKTTYQGFLV
ncbi:unnamed protein product [Brassicogethes aeneus]|uniref:Uncharacterized protein n=1 Tax=Brassicogethes aeneus TaxID=1431903 RepID=A0A9P0B4Q5_BRAAE|nr:unnamed protein product [Brassicogethes aeneus]